MQVNAAFDPTAPTPGALLDRYHTLTAWSDALAAAGSHVEVVQRFARAGGLERRGVRYRFVADAHPAVLPLRTASAATVAAVADATPDVVHVNGLVFPALVGALRRRLPHHVAIVVQDHAGIQPPDRSRFWPRRRWPRGLDQADAVSFTSAEQAAPWHEADLLGDARVLGVVEASTDLVAAPRNEARRATGLGGTPLLLWVGRLNANKDPVTVLDGLDRALPGLPDARVAMIWNGEAPLESTVRSRVQASAVLRARVHLVGGVPHPAMPRYYGAADAFLSGSHAEGSGYALIEALACGLVPIVTEIPSFGAIAGPCGARWRPGDAAACAAAIARVCASPLADARADVLRHFTRNLTWAALATQTLSAYADIARRRRARDGAA